MLKRILPYYKYLKPIWFQFVLGILFGILYSISSGLGLPVMAETIFPMLFGGMDQAPEFMRKIAINYFDGKTDGFFLLFCCLSLPAVVLIRTVGQIGNGYFMSYSAMSVVQAVQIDMFKKVQSLPMSFFNGYKTGEINAAVMGYPHQIKTAVVEISNDLVIQPLTLISAISFLIYKSFQSESFFMAVIGISSAPLIVFLIRRIGIYLAKKAKQLVVYGEALGSSVIETFQSPIEIRAYNLENKQIKDFVYRMKQIFVLHMKSVRFGLLMSPSIEFISGVGIAIALYLGVKNGMGEGDFLALVVALYMGYTPLKKIGGIMNALKVMEPPLDRLEEVLHADVKISCPRNPKRITSPFKGEIKFDNVSFGYHDDQKTLKDISVSIPFGESVGVVGESGAGKSTFVNLLIRLYDPRSGLVLFDNTDIREMDLKELRNLVSYVPQTPILFNDTVIENIRLGRPEADESEIIEAAKYAKAHEFISELDDGYNTMISERGASLSGGQRQRISIARAFLKNSPILILDEATSSLDNKADSEIKESLHELCKGRTSIIIAHRLSSLENINKRMILRNGELVAFGKHEELIKTCDYYKEIVSKQAVEK